MRRQNPLRERLVPILPGPQPQASNASLHGQDTDAQPSTVSAKTKRSIVGIACENCRRRKAKCDGLRPSCRRCQTRGESCVYGLDRGKALTTVLRQKQDVLLRENEKYRQLYHLLHAKPEAEALEVFRRVRETREPESLFEALKQTEMALSNPSSPDADQLVQLEYLDSQALDGSRIKVPARPWTPVVGDGLMSELITNMFTWNGTYLYPVLDQDAFIEDMKGGNPETSKWCTPLLVNAICAVESNFSQSAKQYEGFTGQNLSERFLDEAKEQLERERGRASIPTIVALILLYMAVTMAGRDRSARMYRYTAYALLNHLSLEEKFRALEGDPGGQKMMDIISRTSWGLYVMESRIAFNYSQPSMLPAPRLPKPIEMPESINVDGLEHEERPDTVPMTPGIHTTNCVLTEMWNEVMQYICGRAIQDSDNDLRVRKGFYCKLLDYMAQLSPRLNFRQNMTPTTCLVRMHETEVVLTILRDIPLDTPFHTLYHLPGTTVRGIILQRCLADIELISHYLQKWKTQDVLVPRHAHLCMHTLIPLLDDQTTHSAFTTACMIVEQSTLNMELMGYLLQGVQAFAFALGKDIPETARPFLQGWGAETCEPDLPLAFVLPYQDHVEAVFSRGTQIVPEESEHHLGALIERWATAKQ